ncbi:belong to Rho subfamily [Mollisia scopiformis]|uniref:Belong to Rho subfamily n=1 Tax=Mollisia scopiformis TaxID=149040 RepID=A0A194XM47_MOLSC|nr:belong to Rho subfamily [Mollisia scopiformis]KUJ21159.1 belong to Rho subfamily [Mollisia scopiformis]
MGFKEYLATGFGNFVAEIEVDGKHIELDIWDTPAQEDYDRARPLAYPDTHVVLICFSIDSPELVDNVEYRWISEISHFCPGIPILLIGTKKDLRYDQNTIEELRKTNQTPVTWEQGEELRRKIGAYKYLECSAKTGEGVREVFEHACRATLSASKKKKIRWSLFGKSQ